MAGFNPVADLKPFKSMWKIRVKIIRLWKQFTAAGGLTIEMVLIDANVSFYKTLFNRFFWSVMSIFILYLFLMSCIFIQGDKIHATVKKELVNQFDPFLAEGKTKMMINLSLNHSCGSYRTTNHLYKISFLATTRVKICEDLPRAINGFQPVNYREILDGTLNSDHLVGK